MLLFHICGCYLRDKRSSVNCSIYGLEPKVSGQWVRPHRTICISEVNDSSDTI